VEYNLEHPQFGKTHNLETQFGNTIWKHNLETQFGNNLETQFGNTI
jgi:hypothetical protein